MKTLKVSRNITPTRLVGRIMFTLSGQDINKFYSLVLTSVSLNAKNGKNFNSKDLAVQQVIDLAEKFQVNVEWK